MSTIVDPNITADVESIASLQRRFTVQEYRRLFETGVLDLDERLELLDGRIYRMSPLGRRHMACVKRLNRFFNQHAGERAVISVQDAIELDLHSEPEPDLALLKHRDDFYEVRVPLASDVLLVIEVADTSETKDRRLKMPLYAAQSVPEAWLVCTTSRTVEVYRDPREGRYQSVTIHQASDAIPCEWVDGGSVPLGRVFGE